MAQFTGSTLYVSFGGTELTSRYRTFEPAEEIGLVDKSAGADAEASYLKTKKDGSAALEILAETADALWTSVEPGDEGDLVWAPEGTATGKPRHTVNAIVRSRRKSVVADDVVKISVDFQFSGALVDDTYPA